MTPKYESITLKKDKAVISDKIKAECKTDLISEETEKIIYISSQIYNVISEITDGRIKFGGKIVFYCTYEDKDKNVRKKECANEFSGVLSCDVKVGDKVKLNCNAVRTQTDDSGAFILFSEEIEIEANVYSEEKENIFVGGDDLILKTAEKEIYKSFGKGELSYSVSEEKEVSYKIKDVLSQKYDVVVSACQCGVESVIVDGNVIYTLLLLQNSEKSGIIKEDGTIPFRIEIPLSEAMPTMTASAEARLKNFKLDVAVSEEDDKSTINFNIGLMLNGECFVKTALQIAEDVFSTTTQLAIKRNVAKIQLPVEIKEKEDAVRLKAGLKDTEKQNLVCILNGKVQVIKKSGTNDEGAAVFVCDCLFSDGDGRYFTERAEGSFSLPAVEKDCVSCYYVKNCRAKLNSPVELEIEFDSVCVSYFTEESEIEYIESVADGGEKKANDSSLSVYLAEAGEDLWSLAKRLNVCPEELVASNKELQFPLTENERIIVYRQK